MTARGFAGAFLTFYGLAALILTLARCSPAPAPQAPPYWLADAGTPCDGGCPYDASTGRVGPSAAAVLDAVLRAAAEVTAEAEGMPDASAGREIACDDDGCRVVPVDGGRRLETLEREVDR